MLISRESKDLHIRSRLVLSIQVSGRVASATALVNRLGAMEPNIQASGERVVPMEKVSSSMWTVISMMAAGQTTRPMVAECISMSTVLSMRACGRMICNTAMVSRPGLTHHALKETMHLASNTVSEATSGMMGRCTQVNGARIKSAVSAFTPG